ncbi:MAG TPA: hypothetical protein VNO21_23945, partial [Polyangiaceae bacterium]|nr:hypothetical protein [Polyangiaceae bacterium]
LSGMVLAHVVTLAIVHPRAAPMLALVALETLALALLAQTLVASVTAVILRRLRIAFGLLVVAAAVATLVVASSVARAPSTADPTPGSMWTLLALADRLGRFRGVLESAAEWFPGTWGVRSAAYAAQGHPLDALACHAYPLGLAWVGALVASRLMAREVASGGIVSSAQPTRLWSFGTPAWGVARVTWVTLMDSAIGRVGLIAPLLTIALVRLPVMHWVGGSLGTPGAYAYIAMSTSAIQLNQFGLDGHGVKSLFLLPVSTRDLLRGKTFGLAAYYCVQAFLLALLLALVQKTPPVELIAGVLLGGSFFLTQNMVGRWTSAWLPRRLPRRDMRGTGAPGGLALVSLGLSLVTGGIFGALYLVCQRLHPALLVPANAALFAALLVTHRGTRTSAVKYFEARREKVLAAIE